MIIDTHAHLNFRAFDGDRDEAIKRCQENNIVVVNVGTDLETSKKAVEIAENNEGMYAAIGLHPIHAKDEDFLTLEYESLWNSHSGRIVAIGEIGLDYFKDYGKFKEKQKEVLLEQLGLTKELDLPAILHCRMAHKDLTEILKKQRTVNNEQLRGVIHCFTGSWKEARQYLEMGFYLGMNGIMFKFDLEEVIKKTPLDRIVIETDSPYLTPPQTGVERNEPIYLKYVINHIAKIKGLGSEEVSSATTQNAKTLFNI